MPFNPKERSELEKRFEELFQTAFQCRVTDILDPQYEVNYKGQIFYIDYVYKTDTEKIAIELDGRSKFNDKEYYNYFMRRHNYLEMSDYKVFHFTWDDVTNNRGIVAKRTLRDLFVKIIRDKKQKNHQDSLPKIQKKPNGLLIYLIPVALLGLALTLFLRPDAITSNKGNSLLKPDEHPVIKVQPKTIKKIQPPISHYTKATGKPEFTSSTKKFVKPVNAKKESIVNISVPVTQVKTKPPIISVPSKAPSTVQEQPVQSVQPAPQASQIEYVKFNATDAKRYYFNPNSYFGRKCHSCVLITKQEAIEQGGSPAPSYHKPTVP